MGVDRWHQTCQPSPLESETVSIYKGCLLCKHVFKFGLGKKIVTRCTYKTAYKMYGNKRDPWRIVSPQWAGVMEATYAA